MQPDLSPRSATARRQASAGAVVALWRGACLRCGRFGRPIAIVLVLVSIGGGVSVARALFDTGDASFERGLATSKPGLEFALPRQAARLAEDELETMLASLKEGTFGVAFATPATGGAALDRRLDGTAPHAVGDVAPVVLVDAANPPLRVDIMGLGTATAVGVRASQEVSQP